MYDLEMLRELALKERRNVLAAMSEARRCRTEGDVDMVSFWVSEARDANRAARRLGKAAKDDRLDQRHRLWVG